MIFSKERARVPSCRRRRQQRPDQERLTLLDRKAREIKPAPPDRRGAGRGRRLPGVFRPLFLPDKEVTRFFNVPASGLYHRHFGHYPKKGSSAPAV